MRLARGVSRARRHSARFESDAGIHGFPRRAVACPDTHITLYSSLQFAVSSRQREESHGHGVVAVPLGLRRICCELATDDCQLGLGCQLVTQHSALKSSHVIKEWDACR